jgi:PAS domain S-box-containing protein
MNDAVLRTASVTPTTSLIARLRKSGRLTVLGALALSLVIAGVASFLSDHYQRDALAAGEQRATQLARTGASQLQLILFNADRALRRAGNEIAANPAAPPSAFLTLASFPDRVHVQLAFIDAAGRMTATSFGRLPQPIDLADREYVTIHNRRPDGATFVMPPVASPVNGRSSIPVTRSVHDADGNLLGIVIALLDAEALGDVLHSVSMTDDDVLDVVASNGSLWLRWPRAIADVTGGDISAFVTRQAPVADWPLTVRVGLSRAALAETTVPIRAFIALSALAQIALIGLFAFLMLRRSDQIVAERDAAASARRDISAMIDAVPADIMELDRDGVLKRANSRAMNTTLGKQAALGLPLREVLERAWDAQPRLSSPGERREWLARQLGNLQKGGVFEERSRGGKWRRIYVEPMPDSGRLVLRLDISDSKRREEQLAHIFEAKGAFMVLLDAEQRVVLANRAFAAIVGRSQAELVGQPYAGLGFGEIPATAYEAWRAPVRLAARQSVEYDTEIEIDAHKHVVRFTANPASNLDGALSHIVLIGVDDTARRESEIRLFDSARLANLGEMATGIAHEVNQPLAIMRLAAESASEELEAVGEGDAPPETVDFVEGKLKRISQQTERAANIIRDLRTVARKPANQAEPFDLAEAVRVACNLMQEQLKLNRVAVRLDLPRPGPIVLGEPGRLQQVVINLMNNARDAILERAPEAPTSYVGHIDVSVSVVGSRAVLCVDDDGPGIAKAHLQRVFEPFFTTKPTGKGTGLGLSISYDILKRMGGEITAENRPSGGARFRIALDLHHQEQTRAA